jgi:hypothetical protein
MNKYILVPFDKYTRLLQHGRQPTVSVTIPDPLPCPLPESLQDPQQGSQLGNSESLQCNNDDFEHILAVIPDRAKPKARALLQLLQTHVRWATNGALILQDGETISGSHGADLVKYTVQNHFKQKPPIGYTAFAVQLKKLNIPRSLMANDLPSTSPQYRPAIKWIGLS